MKLDKTVTSLVLPAVTRDVTAKPGAAYLHAHGRNHMTFPNYL